jgi:enoyl-CoA hydratase
MRKIIMKTGLLSTEKSGHVMTLILDRPEKRNALSPDMLMEMKEIFDEFSKTDEVRTFVIRGAGGKAFSAGYDIGTIPTKGDPDGIREKLRSDPLELALESVIHYPYPVIAMLNGYAYGAGCELSMCCDIRVAADDTRMGMTPAKLGAVYAPTGIQRFVQTIGLSRTKELFFTGRIYEAPMIKEKGLVDYVVPKSELESFTYGLAKEIAGNAPLSLKGTKRIINILMRRTKIEGEDLIEAEAFMKEAFHSEDLKEGQTAFSEKRKPQFKGR